MEALMKVCCDDTQCHMYYPHPLMLLIAALNTGKTETLSPIAALCYNEYAQLACHAVNSG